MSNNVFETAVSRSSLQYDIDNEIYGLFSFNPPAMADENRAPLDLAVALDRSGSMGGGRDSKMENAKRSLLKLINHLKPCDRLSVVVFDSSVDSLFEPMKMTAGNKKTAIEALKRVRSGSMTNLSGGLLMALEFLSDKASKGTVRRCLLFTDGAANEGIRDADSILTAANKVRGAVPISTFGYGTDCNSELLNQLAVDGGNYHYIDTPDKILSAFGVELGGLLSTYGQNVRVTLTPSKGVTILEVLNDLTVKENSDGSVQVTCDDLLAEQPYHLVVNLKVEARDNAHPRGVSLVKAKAKLYDVANTTPLELTASMKVKFVKPGRADTQDNPQVMEEVALQKVVAAQAVAIRMADVGDFLGAQKALSSSAAFAASVGTDMSEKLGAAAEGMSREYFSSRAVYTAGGRQKSSASHRVLRRRTGGSAGLYAGGVQMDAMFSSETQSSTRAHFEADHGDDLHAKNLAPNPGRQFRSFGGVNLIDVLGQPPDPIKNKTPSDSGSNPQNSLTKSRSDRW